MPDPDYYVDSGKPASQEDFDKAREEQKEVALKQQEEAAKEEEEAQAGQLDSPTPAADLGEGALAAGGSEEAPGPTGSSDPDASTQRQENAVETGSTVTEDEVKSDDKDDSKDEKSAAKKPAAKKAADKK